MGVGGHHVDAGLCYQGRKQLLIPQLLAADAATQPQRHLATVTAAAKGEDSGERHAIPISEGHTVPLRSWLGASICN